MGLFDRLVKRDGSNGAENPRIPISASNFLQIFGVEGGGVRSASGVNVTIDAALGVPAVWAAVNFMAGTLASLPLVIFKRDGEDRKRVRGKLATLLSDAVNEETTSFDWRKSLFDAVLTGGRHCTYIERNAAGAVINFWPLDPKGVTIKRRAGLRIYEYRDGDRDVTYKASEVIDLAFMLQSDRLGHRGPIMTNRDVIGKAIAITQYGSKFFQNGGVPPFAVTGKFQTAAGMQRGAEQLAEAVLKAAKEQRQALMLPEGLEIKPIGSDPDKTQLIEAHRFVVEEIARIYSLPPAFIQDLTHGTFSNTEQQDLHFVKHTLLRWVKQFEQELNLKLFGRESNINYVEMNVDGLLRGDFKTRMEGYSTAVNCGVMKPNEARQLENRPGDPFGDRLFIQGATVPIETAGQHTVVPPKPGDKSNAA